MSEILIGTAIDDSGATALLSAWLTRTVAKGMRKQS
jgi:hypothetical protein